MTRVSSEEKLLLALEQVSDHLQGKNPLKMTCVVAPNVDVKKVRSKTGLSQTDFAKTYGFTTSAIKNWEQMHRVPEGPSRILLALIEKDPEDMKQKISGLRIAA